MYIVHTGWNGCDGPEYCVGGVFSTKAKAMSAAKELAETFIVDDDEDYIEKTSNGYDVTGSEANFSINVEPIKLDKKASDIGAQLESAY